jgi:molybdate transport system ATP-binding protein
MTLHAVVTVTLGTFTLDVDVTCASGETVAIVGPNGSGKTTLLRAVAGLQPLTAGRVELDGVALDDLPPERRSIGFMFHDDALFPHLRVVDNVGFGLRARGDREPRSKALAWLERVGLADQADSFPDQLSAGQAQRVALARALAPAPTALLLDEPLGALDATTRNDIRRLLRAHLSEFAGPRLLVTHDPVDAAVLSDRVVVLDGGRVVQSGTVAEITARPRHAWVADLAGTNLFTGTAAGSVIALDGGGELYAARSTGPGAVYAAVNPRAVVVHRERPTGSARNVWSGPIETVDAVGDCLRVRIASTPAITAEVTVAAGVELELAAGVEVWVAVKATEVDVYPA